MRLHLKSSHWLAFTLAAVTTAIVAGAVRDAEIRLPIVVNQSLPVGILLPLITAIFIVRAVTVPRSSVVATSPRRLWLHVGAQLLVASALSALCYWVTAGSTVSNVSLAAVRNLMLMSGSLAVSVALMGAAASWIPIVVFTIVNVLIGVEIDGSVAPWAIVAAPPDLVLPWILSGVVYVAGLVLLPLSTRRLAASARA